MASAPGVLQLLAAFLIAIILQLLPANSLWIAWKPNFILVLVIALILNHPEQFGVGLACLLGILADGIYGTSFGHLMFVFVVCGGLSCILGRWTSYFAITYRMLSVFALCILAGLLQSILFNVQGLSEVIQFSFGSAVLSAAILPLFERFFVISNGF